MDGLQVTGINKPLKKNISVPSDKSISHRAIIFSALAEETTIIENFLQAEDTLNTIKIFQDLGVNIKNNGTEIIVEGVGLRGLKQPKKNLDVGNSGTGIRLILGVLAGQQFESIITGDASIRKRPMNRVALPLSSMGATIMTQNNDQWIPIRSENQNYAPLKIIGGTKLSAIKYKMPVSSAQVKSSLLLAGMYANETTEIIDPGFSRNHTEIMLKDFGVDIICQEHSTSMTGNQTLKSPEKLIVPSDISAAAFWLVLGCILPDTEITLKQIGLNPTRTGIIDALLQMGAKIKITKHTNSKSNNEIIGDIIVKSSILKGRTISGALIPKLIDEIPVLAVAAAFAKGTTVISDAQELKVKESDRIKTTTDFLRQYDVKIEAKDDGLVIQGGHNYKNRNIIDPQGDHRIAMAAAIMGCASKGNSHILNPKCISTSYPTFIKTLASLF